MCNKHFRDKEVKSQDWNYRGVRFSCVWFRTRTRWPTFKSFRNLFLIVSIANNPISYRWEIVNGIENSNALRDSDGWYSYLQVFFVQNTPNSNLLNSVRFLNIHHTTVLSKTVFRCWLELHWGMPSKVNECREYRTRLIYFPYNVSSVFMLRGWRGFPLLSPPFTDNSFKTTNIQSRPFYFIYKLI